MARLLRTENLVTAVAPAADDVIGVYGTTGGSPSIATFGDYKVVTFAVDATFNVTTRGTEALEYLVIGGGGGGGITGGGGGGGAFRAGFIDLDVGDYDITVASTAAPGGGQQGLGYANDSGQAGFNSKIADLVVAIGGGGGGSYSALRGADDDASWALGFNADGASGGGAGGKDDSAQHFGLAVTAKSASFPRDDTMFTRVIPSISLTDASLPLLSLNMRPPTGTTDGLGHNGGENWAGGSNRGAGGGGGAGNVGGNGANDVGGDGGPGLSSAISGTLKWYCGGGGGCGGATAGSGGIGGGGAGKDSSGNGAGVVGTAYTGGGGGGTYQGGTTYPTAGGTGIVLIRYRWQ